MKPYILAASCAVLLAHVAVAQTTTPFGTGSLVVNGTPLDVAPAGTGGNAVVTAATDSGATFTYGAGTVLLNKGGNTSLTFTVGSIGAAANSTLVRGTRGTLVIAPAGGTDATNFGSATGERFIVNGGVPVINVNGGANTMVSPTIFGQNNDANKSGDFLNYDATNGFVLATYGNTNFSGATDNTTVANVTAAQTVAASRSVFALKTSAAISLNSNQTLTIGNGSGQAGLILNGGSIQPGASQTGTALAFGGAEGVIYTSGANGTISTVVTGTAGVTKTGPGLLTLSGANTFSGGLVLNGGSTRLTVANTINGGITINSGATLEANTQGGDNTAFNNLFGAAGNSFTFDGGTFLGNNGTDRLLTGRTVTVGAGGGTFNIAGNYTDFVEGTFTQVRLTASTSLLNGSGTVVKDGGGRLQFQTASAGFSGAIVVNNGTLEAGGGSLGNASATNKITLNGGNLASSGTLAQALTLNGGAISTNGGSLTVNGAVNVTAQSYVFLNEFWRDFDNANANTILSRSATITGKLTGTADLGVAVNRAGWRSNNGTVILKNTANDYSGTITVGKNLRLESNATAGTGNTLGTASIVLAEGGLNLRDNGTTGGETFAYGNNVTVTAATDIYARGTMAGSAFIDVNRASGTTAANNTFRFGSLTLGSQSLTVTGGNGYGLEFGGASRITADATLNVNSAPLTFSGGLGEDVTGGRSLTKNGAAALIFTGDSTYTGATTINAGTLVVGGTAGKLSGTSSITLANNAGLTIDNSTSNVADRVKDSTPISMNGSSLTLTSLTSAATNAAETVGPVTLVDGLNTIAAVQGNSGAISALTLSSLARQNQATVNFSGTNLGAAGNGSRIIIANQTTDIPFIPWATAGGDFVQYVAASDGGFVRGITPVAYTADPTDDTGLAASQNVKLVANDLALTANRSVNSVNFANTADGRTLNVSDKTLTVASGAILVGTNAAAINGTTGGITSGSGELVFTNNAALSVGAIVKDNAGALKLTKTGTGTLTLSGVNTFTGDVSVNQGTLSISDVANTGQASNIGAGSAVKLADTLAPVTLRFTGATDSTDRALTVASGGAIVDVTTAATNLTWSGAVTSAGSVSKVGAGTLTLGGTTNINGNVTATAGTIGITGANTVIAGDLNVGANGTTASITSSGGGLLSVGSGSGNNINIGTEVVSAATNSSGTVNLSGLSSFIANVNQIRVGSDIVGTGNAGVNTGSLILAQNNTIIATGGILVGDNLQDGANPGVRNITFGSGVNDVTTPVLTIGGRKYSSTGSIAPGGILNLNNTGGTAGRTTLNVAANTGLATGTEPVSSFDLSNGTIVASLLNVNVADRTGAGNNPGVGDATGSLTIGTDSANALNIAPTGGIALMVGRLDFQSPPAANVTPANNGTSGARSNGTVTINGGTHIVTGASGSSAVVLGNFSGTFADGTPTVTHSATGTFVLNGGSFTVNANGTNPAFNLGAVASTVTGANNTSTGTLTINGGTLTVNNQIQGNSTVAQSTSTLNLTGGTLNMAGKNITNINNVNFIGGTLRNLGTINRALDQTGDTSLLDVAANNTTISGAYKVTDGDVNIATGRTLNVSAGMTAGGDSGTSEITVNGTISGSVTANAGAVIKGSGNAGVLTLAGGIIAPGTTSGILSTGNLSLGGGTLALDINGATAGTGYDQINTTGSVSLSANTNFTLSIGFVPAVGQQFTLINNDSTDLVNFSNGALLSFNGGAGIADDTTFRTPEGYEFRLDYNGGSGNDVVLVTTVPEPSSAMVLLTGVGSLLGMRRLRRRENV